MPFRWSGFTPNYAATTARIRNRGRSTGLHSPASTQPLRPPTAHENDSWPEVSAVDFSPVHFRGPQARQVSCYALFKEWLLLSLSSCCLSSRTPFSLTLSRHLGALTSVWVAPLSVMRLTPINPHPSFFRANAFGVRNGSGTFRSLASTSVLYNVGNVCSGRAATRFGGN